MTYVNFIENKINCYKIGEPIYTSDLAESLAEAFQLSRKEAAAAVSVAIKRLKDNKTISNLRFFQKGIYYKTKETPFGETGINKDVLITDKYLSGDNGYETGFALLHHMGLTTQIPVERVLVTNRATNCTRHDKVLDVFISPPKVRVSSENKYYLQVLDAIDIMNKAPIDAERPFHTLADHIQTIGLDYRELLALADKYYSKNTVLKLAQIAGERE